MKVCDIMTPTLFVSATKLALKMPINGCKIAMCVICQLFQSKMGNFIGMVTHKKMITSVLNMLNKYGQGALDRRERYTPIADIMDTQVQKLRLDEPLTIVVQYFIDNKLGCLPVEDDQNKVLGIVTSSDFVKLCQRLLLTQQ